MTTATLRPTASTAKRTAGVAAALGRPSAMYHLALGAGGLLIVLGLVMVLSASSVASYAASGSSFSVFGPSVGSRSCCAPASGKP